MELCLKITAGLLLLVQAFHLASLQDSTDSPGRTIDKSWLRGQAKNTTGSQNSVIEEENENDQQFDLTTMESSSEYSSGIASGSMAVNTEEEQNVAGQDKDVNETSENLTTTEPSDVMTYQPELPDTTADPMTSSQVNMTEVEAESYNSSMTPQNSTSFPDYSNHTHSQKTTLAPERNATTKKTGEDTGLANATTSTTTTTPKINKTLNTSSSTTVFLSETTETSPATTSTAVPNTPKKSNETDRSEISGSSSEKGLASNSYMSRRKGAWGAVLGTAVAVACVGLVAYILLKKKHQKGFSHRKLVEEYPADPVLRLDNNEPLDLNFDGSAYYNPGLQGDNIQMTNFPERHQN